MKLAFRLTRTAGVLLESPPVRDPKSGNCVPTELRAYSLEIGTELLTTHVTWVLVDGTWGILKAEGP